MDYQASKIINVMQTDDTEALREYIREVLTLELNEFMTIGGAGAGTAPGHSIAGYTLPLGASNRKDKKKKRAKLKESKSKSKSTSLSGHVVGDEDFTFNNHFRYSVCEDGYHASEHFEYYDAIGVASRAFADSENPFGKNRTKGIEKSLKYLQGFLKYPHLT